MSRWIHRTQRDDDAGFTLIELIAAATISVVLVGTLSATLILLLQDRGAADERLNESRGGQTLASFLQADVNSTPPNGANADEFLAVTCGSATVPGSNVLTLAWSQTAGGVTRASTATYRLRPAENNTFELVRTLCADGVASGTLVTATALDANAVANTSDPRLVTLDLQTSRNKAGQVYTYRVVAVRKNPATRICTGSLNVNTLSVARLGDGTLATDIVAGASASPSGDCPTSYFAEYFADGALRPSADFSWPTSGSVTLIPRAAYPFTGGIVTVNVRQRQSTGEPGATVFSFDLEVVDNGCVITPDPVSPPSVGITGTATGTLTSTVTVRAAASATCTAPLTLTVDTGQGSTGPLTMALTSGKYELQLGGGSSLVWTPGVKQLDIRDGGGFASPPTFVTVTGLPCSAATLAWNPDPGTQELLALQQGTIPSSLAFVATEGGATAYTDLRLKLNTGVVSDQVAMTRLSPTTWGATLPGSAYLWAPGTHTIELIETPTGSALSTLSLTAVNPCAAIQAPALSTNQTINLTGGSPKQLAQDISVSIVTAGSCTPPASGGVISIPAIPNGTSPGNMTLINTDTVSSSPLIRWTWSATMPKLSGTWDTSPATKPLTFFDGPKQVKNSSGGGFASTQFVVQAPVCAVSNVTGVLPTVSLSNRRTTVPISIIVTVVESVPNSPCNGIGITFSPNPNTAPVLVRSPAGSNTFRATIASGTRWGNNPYPKTVPWSVNIGGGGPLWSGSLTLNNT